MCLNIVTTHTQCLHANLAQIPCPYPSSGLSVLHFTLADECSKQQEDELVDTWCPACTTTWDSIRATQNERSERTEAFRRRNGYYGQLAPLRRAQDGSVVFASDLQYPIQITEKRREDDARFAFSNFQQEVDPFTTISSPQTFSQASSFQSVGSSSVSHTASSSISSLASSKSVKFLPESPGLWPMSFDTTKCNNQLLTERDEFGNPLTVLGEAKDERDRRKDETEVELGAMYRDRDMRRLLKKEQIRPVAPMVSSMVAKCD